ncbi:MAG: response regulator [Spirochaetia bacterium]|jgi:PAS domain S-box-containing protein
MIDSDTTPASPHSPLGQPLARLIVVDDEGELIKAFQEAISGQGYEVSGFTTGAEAVSALKEKDFDLLLTDLMMPEMDGLELFRQAREIDPHIIGIVMTGHATIQTAIEAMKVGVYDYLLKPFKVRSLLPLLDRAIAVRKLGLENVQLRQTLAIYELGQTVSYSLALNTILDKVADGALQQCAADEASVMLLSPAGDELYIAAVRGKDRTPLLGQRAPVDKYVAGWVAGHREPIMLHGAIKDPRYAPLNPRSDIELAVSLPLLVGGKLVGILNLNFTHARRPLTVGELKALSIFSSIAGTALESARMHEEVLAAERKYRGIFEGSPEGIFQTSPDNKRFVTANPAMARILGYDSPEELIGSITNIDEQVFAQGNMGEFECECTRKDGSRIWGTLHTTRADSGAEGIGCEGTLVDITPRKLAEEEIRILSRFPEENPNPVMRLSREGVLIYANISSRPILKDWGCSQGEKIPEEYHDFALKTWSAGTPAGIELACGAATYSAVFAPILEAGYLNIYAMDITQQRTLEQQLLQSQKMDAIGRLAGGVAHDFNNILTAIIGYTDFLQGRLGTENPLCREVGQIRKAGQRAASLTQQLLAFSRRQIFKLQVLDLNGIVNGMQMMLQRLINESISFELHLDPSLGRVRADASQVEQILLNLVINASDAMPRGGKLLIETSNVELDENYTHMHIDVKPGPHVQLVVSDTGTGMDEETRQHLFEPFFTTKERGKGTGLGLSMVFGIVKQSGGNIWVYSEPGRGTAFKIYFPRVFESLEEAPKEPTTDEVPRGSETVLVVEDEGMIREIINLTLVEHGFTVLPAQDGEEAFRICEEHTGPIHLLLCDVILPKMSGRDVVKRLTSRRPDMRVLYMSGYTANAIVHHGVLEPGIAFLQKPFSPAALLAKVREVLSAESPPVI